MTNQPTYSGTIVHLLLGVVLLAPLAMAAVYAWAWGLMAVAVGALLAAWGVRIMLGRGAMAVPIGAIRWAIVPFVLVLIYVLLQSMAVVPSGLHHPLWQIAADALGMDYAGRISVNPSSTTEGIARLLTYAGIFWLALQVGRQRRVAYRVFYIVAIGTGLYAAYGLVNMATGADTIFWFDMAAYPGDFTDAFVNRSTFAAYAGLGCISAAGLLMGDAHNAIAGLDRGRERYRRLIEHVATGSWPLVVACLILFVTLLLTYSRGGLLASLIGFVALFAAMTASRTFSRRTVLLLAAAVFVAGASFFALGGGAVSQHPDRAGDEAGSRHAVYDRTMEAIGDASLLGTGLGTFQEVLRSYRTQDMGQVYDVAPSTYLENALELGIPAAAGLAAAVAILVLLCGVGVRRRRRDAIYPCIGVAATALVAAHALTDFSLQLPAVTATYMLILGIACAQSWSSSEWADD